MAKLEDKVAIVVGAGTVQGGMGNGKAAAIALAREGASVAAVDIDMSAAEETAGIIRDSGGRAIALKADATKEKQAQQVVESTVAELGKVDILFNNIGTDVGGKSFRATEEEWDRIMNINLKGIYFASKYAVLEMKKTGGGVIVNNASMAAFTAFYVYAYSAAKGGVVAMTRSMAASLGKYNIRVNCVSPGLIATPMGAPVLRGDVDHIIQQRVPLKRRGQPEDVANVVVFLASEDSSYVTGQAICVDGGMSIM